MPLNLITDIDGLTVGHASDLQRISGVTVVAVARPNVAAVSVRGGAPGSREHAILDPVRGQGSVDALVLSGGSAFGLDAAGGAMVALSERGRGFAVGPVTVPIVPQAILFDLLSSGQPAPPRAPVYWELGKVAAEAALAQHDGADTNAATGFALGSVGAGTGATTATLKGGVGSASIQATGGITVAALAAVNALGSATVGEGPFFWAGAYEQDGEFGGLGLPAQIETGSLALRRKDRTVPATTIAIVATDAALDRTGVNRVALMAEDGLARAIRPAHGAMDGDTVFAVARPLKRLDDDTADVTEIGAAAADCLARAIARGVYCAMRPGPAYTGPPTWAERFGTAPAAPSDPAGDGNQPLAPANGGE